MRSSEVNALHLIFSMRLDISSFFIVLPPNSLLPFVNAIVGDAGAVRSPQRILTLGGQVHEVVHVTDRHGEIEHSYRIDRTVGLDESIRLIPPFPRQVPEQLLTFAGPWIRSN